MVVQYSNNAAYGRKYARGASSQRLSRNARGAAFRRHSVDVDMENFHPSLLIKTLRETPDSDGRSKGIVERSYHVLTKYVLYYKGGWGGGGGGGIPLFLRSYYVVGAKEAKEMPDGIFYGGGRTAGDGPFLHIIRCEAKAAAEYLT